MHPRIADQAAMQQTGTQVLHRAFDGLSDDQLRRRGSEVNNNMLWIAAHITTVRIHMAHMLGLEIVNPWGGRYNRGSQFGEVEAPAAAILAKFDEVSEALQKRYPQLTDAELGASSEGFPSTDKTVGGSIHFLTFHDAYHIGQLGFLRKQVGAANLVG